MEPREFFSRLWNDYIEITPQAKVIKRLFETSDGGVINDHVAFRTFAGTPISLEYLEPLILSMGYQRQESYAFKAKKLRAFSFIHSQPELPKIFCSELLTEQLSQKAQGIISTYTQQIKTAPEDLSMFWSGRHWELLKLGLQLRVFGDRVSRKSHVSLEQLLLDQPLQSAAPRGLGLVDRTVVEHRLQPQLPRHVAGHDRLLPDDGRRAVDQFRRKCGRSHQGKDDRGVSQNVCPKEKWN